MNEDEKLDCQWHNIPAVNIGMLLTLAQRLTANQYSTLLEPLKLTPVQSQILWTINERAEMTAGSLAELFLVKAPVMTTIVEDLVQLGYVARHQDRSDRRKSLLATTEKGQEILTQLEHVRTRMVKWMTTDMTDAEVQQFTRTLIKMVTTLEKPEQLATHYFSKDEQVNGELLAKKAKRSIRKNLNSSD